MYNPAFHTVSHNADITRDDYNYPTNGRGYIDIDSTGNYNLHLDPYMKHVYSEIPLSPMDEAQHQPLEIHNLKDVEYITNQPGTYNGNRAYTAESSLHPTETTTTSTTSQCYPDITSVNSKADTKHSNVNSVTMDKQLDMYAVDKKSGCWSRQVTIHVIVMALAGIVYLGIGGIAGYYIHKAYGSDDDPVSVTPRFSTSGLIVPTITPDQFTIPGRDSTASPADPTKPGAGATSTEPPIPPTTTTASDPSLCTPGVLMCSCGPVGGDEGQTVSHRDQWLSHGNVSGFTVQHNDYFIGWLQFHYGADPVASGTKLGYTDSGYQVQVTMGKDEFITEMTLDFTSAKPFLTRLLVKTNLRVFEPFGGEGAHRYTVQGSKLMFVEGKSGPLVDQLTAYFDKCS